MSSPSFDGLASLGVNQREARPDYVIVGHVTRDVVPGGFVPGGTVTYAGLAAVALGRRVGAVTSVGPNLEVARLFPSIDFVIRPAHETTTFENVYHEGHRTQWLRSVAGPLDAELVPPSWRAAPIVHLAPLAGEFAGDLVAAFPDAQLVGLTPQGWLRTWNAEGRVRRRPWPDPDVALDRADAVVLSEEDVEDDWQVLEGYAARTRLLVVTQGARGCTVFESGRRWQVPAYPAREVDATGAGDVFAAAFFSRLLESGDPVRAARFANCVASFAVEHVGPGGVPDPARIDARLLAHPLCGSRG